MQVYFHYTILAKLFGTETSLGPKCRHDFTPMHPLSITMAMKKDKSTSVKFSTLNREGGRHYINERLMGKMSLLLKQSKMGKKLPKQSSVANVLLARIVVACGAVSLVLGNFFTTHTYKQMKIKYNLNNTSNYLLTT